MPLDYVVTLLKSWAPRRARNTLQGVEFEPVIYPEWCEEYPASRPSEDHVFLEFEDDRLTRMVELKQDGLLYVHVCIGETELTIKIEGNNA